MRKMFNALETVYFIIKTGCYKTLVGVIFLFLISSSNATERAMDQGVTDTVQAVAEDGTIHTKDDYYIGVFVGPAWVGNRHTDTAGFANWGNQGALSKYNDTKPVGGLLVGKKLRINGVPLRIEMDGTFGDMSASTDRLDPKGRDETAEADVKWLVTVRAGIEQKLGLATFFANGGLALARVANSVIDIDFGPGRPPAVDPDDSFRDESLRLGWVAGLGIEIPLNKKAEKTLQGDGAWILRMDGSYIHLGKHTYRVNHSGNNRCGVDGPREPCFYDIENEVGFVRIAVIKRFSL